MATDNGITVPAGYTLHTENDSHILLPASGNDAFLNPVQEFNRDTSVACIRVWSEETDRLKEEKWRQAQERKAKNPERSGKKRTKLNSGAPAMSEQLTEESSEAPTDDVKDPASEASPPKLREYRRNKFVLLEALSATGLRSIRYAKEIPHVKHVIANDLSPAAVEAMKRNIEINGLGTSSEPAESSLEGDGGKKPSVTSKVQINEGDACALMYNHRAEKSRVDVVDLDPYGTAAPFIDASVQCINDGGLLCVTCTDLSVLATTNYPEKCYSNYGGIPVKSEYCHEAALRLVLNTISTSASRYGRYIEPLLSLSIDFYVRIFVRIKSAPIEVKKTANKTSVYYICTGCQSFYGHPLGKMTEKVHEKSGNVNYLFKTQSGPPVPEQCPECNSTLHFAGPMWSGPIHDSDFVGKVLEHLETNEDKYGTSTRMKGMLTVASEELHTPFFFTPGKIAGFFHCTCPPLEDVASALLHAGHQVSRSHACPGSLKTTATRADVHDVFRSWVKSHPVKMENISEHSPARILLAKEPKSEANFKRHPQSVTPSAKVKLVRYQQNPTSHWGPGSRPDSSKRKREEEE
ncbi:hypothetical protein PLICRDRAFT_625302 [Plicaturopsis crispa FD-325 SS-3]|nr:hypothetical protein PLICRDRAFT_625302 [Plicaturopsis crispa FD-325 SS-3]